MRKLFSLFFLILCLLLNVRALQRQSLVDLSLPMSVRMAESEMIRSPQSWQLDFQSRLKWDYCHGVELQAFLNLYDSYGDKRYFDYAEAYCDTMVLDDGSIRTYKQSDYSLDRINSGKLLFTMYERTGQAKYKIALDTLRAQFDGQPRTAEGGFWHKQIYPSQMWLDGLYMGAPFYAEYVSRFGQPKEYEDIIRQFCVIARHTYNPGTGLYQHAWDESRTQKWADPITGQSAHSWGRAMGWFAMALVETLEFMPQDVQGRDSLLHILDNVVKQIRAYQERSSGLWYQVLDRSGDAGNYLESSVSCMFVYALYKGMRLGVIPKDYMNTAEKGYSGILANFIEVDDKGVISLTRTCAVAGLGGKNYRMGDYSYYINETIRSNDPKAVGPFINACLERERLSPPAGNVRAGNDTIRVLMIGDSTMANKSERNGNPERGWGHVLGHFFMPGVVVDNHAKNGRSSKSFINEGLWDVVLSRIRPGDYVFIQFGHNDEKTRETLYTEPGGSFDDNLRRFVTETRERGGIPVLFNSIVRRKFDNGKLVDTHGKYLSSPRWVAHDMNVPFIDANAITHQLVEGLGSEASKRLFMWVEPGTCEACPDGKKDDTHLNIYGAHKVAWELLSEVKRKVPRLGQYVKYYDFGD